MEGGSGWAINEHSCNAFVKRDCWGFGGKGRLGKKCSERDWITIELLMDKRWFKTFILLIWVLFYQCICLDLPIHSSRALFFRKLFKSYFFLRLFIQLFLVALPLIHLITLLNIANFNSWLAVSWFLGNCLQVRQQQLLIWRKGQTLSVIKMGYFPTLKY